MSALFLRVAKGNVAWSSSPTPLKLAALAHWHRPPQRPRPSSDFVNGVKEFVSCRNGSGEALSTTGIGSLSRPISSRRTIHGTTQRRSGSSVRPAAKYECRASAGRIWANENAARRRRSRSLAGRWAPTVRAISQRCRRRAGRAQHRARSRPAATWPELGCAVRAPIMTAPFPPVLASSCRRTDLVEPPI